MDDIQEAKKLLAQARQENLKVIRALDLDSCVALFNDSVRQYARPVEATSFDSLVATARRSIDNNKGDFESHLVDLRGKNYEILFVT